MASCTECGGTQEIRHADRPYAFGGLPHVTLVNVEVRVCTRCGAEAIAIPRITELHRVLAVVFAMKRAPLLPDEIRFLRTHLEWTSGGFAQQMGVDPATASRWQTGKQTMAPVAERLLRLYVLHAADPAAEVAGLAAVADPRAAAAPVHVGSVDSGWRVAA